MMVIDMSVSIGPVRLPNPVMNASGCGGYGPELEQFGLDMVLGAIVSKGLSWSPSLGAPGVRVAETSSGLLNAIGLQNIGFEAFQDEIVPWIRHQRVPYIANCYGGCSDDYLEVAAALSDLPEIAALEINVSCPNVDAGGAHIGRSPKGLEELIRKLAEVTEKPLWVKIPPDTRDVVEIASAAVSGGAAALTVANTLPAMVIDLETEAPLLGRAAGGLSGPAIHPVALRMVWEVSRAVDVPVIGVGGIDGPKAAIAMILAGAAAVQVGTALLTDPAVVEKILLGMKDWMTRKGYRSLKQFRGRVKPD